jgi:hypothetical protein
MKKILPILLCLALASCATPKIMAFQPMKKEANGKWVKDGPVIIAPDTLAHIKAIIWVNGKRVYGY